MNIYHTQTRSRLDYLDHNSRIRLMANNEQKHGAVITIVVDRRYA